MRDEFGDPVDTALYPVHLGFRAMVQDREIVFKQGEFKAFVDRVGLLDRNVTDQFLKRR